jgi:hypothetical protein
MENTKIVTALNIILRVVSAIRKEKKTHNILESATSVVFRD